MKGCFPCETVCFFVCLFVCLFVFLQLREPCSLLVTTCFVLPPLHVVWSTSFRKLQVYLTINIQLLTPKAGKRGHHMTSLGFTYYI